MKNIGTMFHRQTHKMMAKMGKAEDTKDPEYDIAHEKCVAEGKKVKGICRNTEKLMNMFQANMIVMKQVVDMFSQLTPDGASYMADLNAAMEEVDAARQSCQENLANDMCIPLYRFYKQYRVMKRRAKVLNNWRIDMDRHHDKLNTLTEKSAQSGNAAGIAEAEQKYQKSRELYDNLRAEMMVDFERLHAAIDVILPPAIAVFMREQANYAAVYGRAISQLGRVAQNVDTSALVNYRDAITSENNSAAGDDGRLPDKKPKKDASAAQVTAYGMVAEGAPPPPRTSSYGRSSAAQEPAAPAPAGRAPPPRPPARGPPRERCRALYDFTPEDASELGFSAGDVIDIIKKNGDWWEGELRGRRGLFPGNYVQML